MKLQTYVLRQLAVAFLIASGGILFVALPGIAVGAVHRLAGAGTLSILRYLPIVIGGFIPYALPIAYLLALVATYGRLAADNEWTAIRMAGVNPYRMLTPAWILGLVLSGGIYFMNSEVLPWLRYHEKRILTATVRDAIKNLNPGRPELAFGPFFLSSRDRDEREPATFIDVFIEYPDREVEGKRNSLFAERASFDFDSDYMYVRLEGARGVFATTQFIGGETFLAIPLQVLLPQSREDYSSPRYKSSGALLSAAAEEGLPDRDRRIYMFAFHGRITNALTCLMFVLLGAPTGILMRRGTQLAALAVAVGYAILYWISSLRLGETLGRAGVLPPAAAAWGMLGLWVLIALFLTRRAFSR